MTTLKDLLLHELAGIYDAEQQLARALPAFEKAASAERLQKILRKHTKETEEHVTKLGTVFEHLGVKAKGRACASIAGLITETNVLASTFAGSPALDAALIGAIQKVEHHEIATFGCLHEWAELLGNGPATAVLLSILEEEKTANEALTQLARARCNEEANVESAAADTAPNAADARSAAREAEHLVSARPTKA